MKRPLAILWALILLSLGVLLFATIRAHAAGGPTYSIQLIVTNTSTTTPVVLAVKGTFCQSATLVGNFQPQINNTGNVFVGTNPTNGMQPIQISPGATLVLKAPPGEWIDLHDWSLGVKTANDGLTILYTP